MNKIFESITRPKIKKSAFDLSHEMRTTTNYGKLVPVLTKEVLPGDEVYWKGEALVRVAPMTAPPMMRNDVYFHAFYVPNRLLDTNWENFITGGEKGEFQGDNAPPMPMFNLTEERHVGAGSLADHMGIGIKDYDVANFPLPTGPRVQKYPFQAYQMIFNEYYRDEWLQEPIDLEGDVDTLTKMRYRSWEKDYFTSALPSPQKGPAAIMPLTGIGTPNYLSQSQVYDTSGAGKAGALEGDPLGIGQMTVGGVPGRVENLESIDLTGASFTIEELRRTSKLQEFLELGARGGTRFKEFVMNFFGKNIGDARIDRPEYLGGGKSPIVISEVLNTVGVQGQAPQGEMAGHGISVSENNTFKYNVPEWGWIIVLMSIMPKATYKQGVHRQFTREDRLDYYFEQFQNIGEQEVKSSELHFDPTDVAYNDSTLGYQMRYAEYKYECNKVSGDFKKSLSFWTDARQFDNQPVLNTEFVTCDDPILQNIFASTDEEIDKFYVQIYHDLKMRRPMNFFSKPELA